jgi:hypothetical protein
MLVYQVAHEAFKRRLNAYPCAFAMDALVCMRRENVGYCEKHFWKPRPTSGHRRVSTSQIEIEWAAITPRVVTMSVCREAESRKIKRIRICAEELKAGHHDCEMPFQYHSR